MAKLDADFIVGDLYDFICEDLLVDDDELAGQIDASMVTFTSETSSRSNVDQTTGQVLKSSTQNEMFPSVNCNKKYKAEQGLLRHMSSKHDSLNVKLEKDELMVLIKGAASKLASDDCFPSNVRYCFRNITFDNEEIEKLLEQYTEVIKTFQGNAESFYSKIYGINSNLNSFGNLKSINSQLLSAELANHILNFLNKSDEMGLSGEYHQIDSLPDQEKQGLQYIVGHMFHNFYKKFRSNKNWQSSDIQEILAILKAGKVDDDDSQRLINVKDRGGLWKVVEATQKIFEICEIAFKRKGDKFIKSHKIDIKDLCASLLKDPVLLAQYHNVYGSIDPKVLKENALNLLEELISLYLRIRSHSFAKDITESHKMKSRRSKERSLRTSIKRASGSLEFGH